MNQETSYAIWRNGNGKEKLSREGCISSRKRILACVLLFFQPSAAWWDNGRFRHSHSLGPVHLDTPAKHKKEGRIWLWCLRRRYSLDTWKRALAAFQWEPKMETSENVSPGLWTSLLAETWVKMVMGLPVKNISLTWDCTHFTLVSFPSWDAKGSKEEQTCKLQPKDQQGFHPLVRNPQKKESRGEKGSLWTHIQGGRATKECSCPSRKQKLICSGQIKIN